MKLTFSHHHNYEVGDYLNMTILDDNKFRRFWHFITFRKHPTKQIIYKVESINSETSLNIEKC